ncbi:short-chain collagen C4-like [Mytilus californianus]|uniref:short-chain collagen C4-like n=1 Tax=Mytilus californianus TaxID=6549 RepID=UPI0022454B1D|nr:short-chain collagen C4-like [Mytilus californianus]
MKIHSTYMAIVLATVIMNAENHECKNYVLSASDQSLIDMMEHYLHTSRKEECPPPIKTSNSGVTYVRWGKKSCPKGAEIVYTGQVGGTQYGYRGGGVNYLCLPNDPENGQHQSYGNNQVYGSEYQLSSSMKPSGWSESMADKEVPCSVCYQKHRSTVLMIPGRKSCYKGWNSEYNGYLMSDHNTHFRRDFACVDINAEPVDNKNGNEDGAVFYPTRTKCGSLRCPPYTNETDVLCVVCTK